MDNYCNTHKEFTWINNGKTASAGISGIEEKEICEYYNYMPLPNIGRITGYSDTSFTSLLTKKNK